MWGLSLLAEIAVSFGLGLLTPLTALCVIPLYPAFLSFLSRQFSGDEERSTYILFGLLVAAGVLSFMFLLGLVFTTLLQVSLTSTIEIVSPIAFILLGLISVLMLLDYNFESSLPSYQGPRLGNPLANAFGFGLFFGAIVVPCNPAFIAAFFARALLFASPLANILNFLAFGLGIGFPLVFFSVVSAAWRQRVISFLTEHKTLVNRGSGAVMLAVSFYYLVFVFDLPGIIV